MTQDFTPTPVPGDASGREWILTWTHTPYPIDDYEARLVVAGGGTYTHHFRVDVGGGELRIDNVAAFPNPFDEELGTHFSFSLVSGAPVDVQLRVYTSSGR